MSVLVVDKPVGPTSFAVLRRVRRALVRARGGAERAPKLGHGGTLDPMASGVLPVCVGEATKIVPFLLDADKEYLAVVRFGVETDTLDATGQVLCDKPVGNLDAARVEAVLASFRGEIEQVPPMFSALKHHGQPLYRYARAGQTVARPPRRVKVHDLSLLAFQPPDRARLRIRCSKGTYIRSLAADLGSRLGVGAHLTELRRTASGPFALAQALSLDAIDACVDEGRALPFLSLREALVHLPAVTVGDDMARRLARGQSVRWDEIGAAAVERGPLCVLLPPDVVVAVVDRGAEGAVRILRVFNAG
ncbi:MAG: tRNA pseudouridine(55) synthase TruB [Polyangia bacterium]